MPNTELPVLFSSDKKRIVSQNLLRNFVESNYALLLLMSTEEAVFDSTKIITYMLLLTLSTTSGIVTAKSIHLTSENHTKIALALTSLLFFYISYAIGSGYLETHPEKIYVVSSTILFGLYLGLRIKI